MRRDLIQNILNEKKRKKKKKKLRRPIGRLYSLSPGFADPTIGTPEGMEEGLNLAKKQLITYDQALNQLRIFMRLTPEREISIDEFIDKIWVTINNVGREDILDITVAWEDKNPYVINVLVEKYDMEMDKYETYHEEQIPIKNPDTLGEDLNDFVTDLIIKLWNNEPINEGLNLVKKSKQQIPSSFVDKVFNIIQDKLSNEVGTIDMIDEDDAVDKNNPEIYLRIESLDGSFQVFVDWDNNQFTLELFDDRIYVHDNRNVEPIQIAFDYFPISHQEINNDSEYSSTADQIVERVLSWFSYYENQNLNEGLNLVKKKAPAYYWAVDRDSGDAEKQTGQELINAAIEQQELNPEEDDPEIITVDDAIDYLFLLGYRIELYTGQDEKLETDLNEEGGGLSDTLGQNDLPQVPKWESGMARGHANTVATEDKWESGITRGHANSLYEGLNLPKKRNREQEVIKIFRDVAAFYEAPLKIERRTVNGAMSLYVIFDIIRGVDNLYIELFYNSWGDIHKNKIYGSIGYQDNYPDAVELLNVNINSDVVDQIRKQIDDGINKTQGLAEGLNLVKKSEPSVFKYLDQNIINVIKTNDDLLGKNVFRLYSTNDATGMMIKCLVYPSGKVSILQHRISFMKHIVDEFNITRELFDKLFEQWFKSRYGNQIISEGLNLPKKPKGISVFPDEYKDTTISHGTLRPKDLIESYLSTLKGLQWTPSIQRQVNELSDQWDAMEKDEGGEPIDIESAEYLLDNIQQMMVDLAPVGTSFGSHPGDGSDFGFWGDDIDLSNIDGVDEILQEGLNLVKKTQGLPKFPKKFRNAIVSDGTLNPDHLIPKYLRWLGSFKWRPVIQHQVEELENQWEELQTKGDEVTDDDVDNMVERDDILESLANLMMDLAPEGSYFGSSEGDGALIGFWEYENEDGDNEPDN